MYGSFGGDSFSPDEDIRLQSKESMQVHCDPPISSGPGEMPARIRPTPAEIDLLLPNVIEQAVPVKLDVQIAESQERWRLKFQRIESLQGLDLYDQWCLQIYHCYCRFHREHPPLPVHTTAQAIKVHAVSLEKALEEAFLKVAQEESKDPSITNTVDSWLSEHDDMVRKPQSIGSRSETASHVSCAHHCSRRKEIAKLTTENQAIKINQEKLFSFLAMGRSFAHPPCPLKDPPAGSACSLADEATEVFSLAPTTDSRAEEKKKKREELKERVCESKIPQRVSDARKKEKNEILAEKRYTDRTMADQVLLTQSLLGAAGASGAAQAKPPLKRFC